MFRTIKIGFISIFITVIFFSCGHGSPVNHKVANISAITFQTAKGWGYNIEVDNKIYIHQEFIPVLGTRQGFPSQDVALRCARIVAGKLKKQEVPALSLDDLRQAGISIPDTLNH